MRTYVSKSGQIYEVHKFQTECEKYFHAITEKTKKEAEKEGITDPSDYYDVYIRENQDILKAINDNEEKIAIRNSKNKHYRDIQDNSKEPLLYSACHICNHASEFVIDVEDKSITVFDFRGVIKTKYIVA